MNDEDGSAALGPRQGQREGQREGLMEDLLEGLLEGLPDAAWVVSLEPGAGRVLAANTLAYRLFGRGAGELAGDNALALAASPEDLAWWEAAAREASPAPLHSDTVVCSCGADGQTRLLHVSRSIRMLPAAPGQPRRALVVMADRSAQQQSESAREGLLADLQATLEATADGILVTDLNGHVRAFNRRFTELWGMPLALLQSHDAAAVREWMARCVSEPEAYEGRLHTLERAALAAATDRIELADGMVLERVTRPLLARGRSQGRVWSFRDLTERLRSQQRIEALSLNDALTGLANRRHLTDQLEAAVGALGKRTPAAGTAGPASVPSAPSVPSAGSGGKGRSLALLVIDLDRFRHINDSLGHEMGDRVLLDVARRIQGCLRQEDVLARLGADQFAVLVSPADAAAAEATARRVLSVVAQPCSLEGAQFTLTCSIGVALAPSHGRNADELIRHAEAAMRAVKSAGRANWRLHQARAEVDRRSHMKLDHAMRQALVSGRFRLHYQPQVSLADGRVTGAEALLRWRDPEMGEVPPARFIPVAEDSGFIVPIGDWVLSQAVRQAALWHSSGLSMPVAVNVSALQFEQGHFVDRVASVLAVSGIPPQLLELELTESILLHDADEALHRLHALAKLGVKLSIDDFGTGYSSLAYLKRFPIGKLKIDRSFVKGLPDDEGDAGIVRAILQMARALGMKVIAEGVESEAQRQFLAEAGCDEFQGWLFAPAVDALSFERQWPGSAASPAPAQPRKPAPRIRLVRG